MGLPKIVEGILEPLDKIKYHNSMEYLTRFIFKGINGLHIASHNIDIPNEIEISDYTSPHKHNADELNMILSQNQGGLKYEIVIDGISSLVNSNSVVYIPHNTLHSAKAVSGSGIFLCVLFSEEYNQSLIE